jgi:tetratricopeptide (TPR) repeat protein
MSRAVAFCRVVAALVVIGSTAYAIDRWAVAPLSCARAAWHGTRALGAVEQRQANARAVADEVRVSLQGCDCGTRTDVVLTLADAAETSGDARAAITFYRRALDLDRRPETWFALGMAASDAMDRNAAIDSFTRAGTFDPARVKSIPYEEMRNETARRITSRYGADWLR